MTADKFDKEIAEELASEFGFHSVKNTEKFIMNFRVHKILSAEMSCCLRGGLCTPFYATNPKAKRVSIDLDLFVEDTREMAISKITRVLKGSGMKITARKPRIIKNLLQFDLKYPTTRLLHDEKEHMRIDVMYDVDFNPPVKSISSGHRIFIGKTDYDVTALTRGCLVADKIATLAIKGTGYTKEIKTPKQIHDIAYLLDELSTDDLVESFNVFKVITEFKTTWSEKGSAIEVIQHVIAFLSELLVANSKIYLKQKYKSNFDEFKRDYLSSKVYYSHDELKFNILKTLLYALCTKKTIMGEINADDAAKIAHGGINDTEKPMGEIKNVLKNKPFFIGNMPSAHIKDAIDNESDRVLHVFYFMWKLDSGGMLKG
ncbi:MAG: nucleotidyl transferase AbiEii/AbiGii toxin family protein [Thaumarchaeota archaeon]|nr:nucleotidyl transferase AbiEii/AbiGii toxin family protein [Nitrososphaerota archaeon]